MRDFLHRIINEGGAMAKGYFRSGITYTTKTHLADLVTIADTSVSDYYIAEIQKTYPDHGIYSEERKDIINPDSRYLWMIDPIDGTRNFAMGIPWWCTMIALWEDNELILSAIYNPLGEELFFAERGQGASLNGMPIRVNDVSSLEQGYGLAYRNNKGQRDAAYLRMFDEFNHHQTAWFHNFGSVLAACYIATGGMDFWAINMGFDHDYAAIALICREAGAVVTDSEGNPWTRGRQDIVVANPKLHAQLLAFLHD